MVELRHLRYFVGVAEELHFGRAARRLGLSQPPLSRQIRDLERELGVQLFFRTRRRVELTAAGRVLLDEARDVFERLDRALRSVQRAERGEIGTLSLGYVWSVAQTTLPDILSAFHHRRPEVELSVREMPPAEQMPALNLGRIDAGLMRTPVDDPSLVTETLYDEPFIAALPPGHRLAERARLALADLAPDPFVMTPRLRGPSYFDRIVSMCRSAGFSPHIVQEAPLTDLLTLVAAGLGVSLVPASIRRIGPRGVLFRPVIGRGTSKVVLVWKKGPMSPVLKELVATVRTVASEMVVNEPIRASAGGSGTSGRS